MNFSTKIESQYLNRISGSLINFSFSSKPKLSSIEQFIPENVLLGNYDPIAGIKHGNKKRLLIVYLNFNLIFEFLLRKSFF